MMQHPSSRCLCISLLIGCVAVAACGGESADSATNDKDSTASSSSGGDAAATDSASVDAGTEDVGEPDTGPVTPACKPYKPGDPNFGCPAGQKCIWGTKDGECVPAGTKPAGAECEGAEECAIGLCISNAAGKSRCSPFCVNDVQCTKGPCNALQSGKGKVCDMGGDPVPQCNPLTQNCDKGFACYFTANGFICQATGKEPPGGKCVADNDCDKASVCVGKSGSPSGICRKLCSKSGGSPTCDVGVNCSTLGGNVGYCDG